MLVDLQGFEPRTTVPKTVVLPLHHRSFKTLPKGTPEHSQCTKDISALIFGLLLFTVDNVYSSQSHAPYLQPNYLFRLMQYSTPADYEALRIRTCFLFNNKNSLTQISVMGLAVLYTKLTLAPIFTINTTADTVLTPCTY